MIQETQEVDKQRREVAEGLKLMVNRILDSCAEALSSGNMLQANEFLGRCGTFLLRFEYYALRSGMENDLNEVKQRYFEISRRLGVNLK